METVEGFGPLTVDLLQNLKQKFVCINILLPESDYLISIVEIYDFLTVISVICDKITRIPNFGTKPQIWQGGGGEGRDG